MEWDKTQYASDLLIHATDSQIDIPLDGIYLVSLNIRFAANSTGTRWCGIYKSGSAFQFGVQSAPPTKTCDINVVALMKLTSTQYLTAKCFQNSGGALNVETLGSNFSCARISNS